MTGESRPTQEEVRAADLVAAMSLATDLGTGLPLEHGLESTLLAVRLAEAAGAGADTMCETFYGCLLFHVGCTADAEVAAELFPDGALHRHVFPAVFGGPPEIARALARAVSEPAETRPGRAARVARDVPRAVLAYRRHLAAACEVGDALVGRLGLPPAVRALFAHLSERWDGRGFPGRARGRDIPLAARIVHVARDAALQRLVRGPEEAAQVVRARAGRAFDPALAVLFADNAPALLDASDGRSAWDAALAAEPEPVARLRGAAIDGALAGIGEFADLVSPWLTGHSGGVAELVDAAAEQAGLPSGERAAARRAALVHDVGRVAVSARVWQKPGPLSAGEREEVRLHAYHGERVLRRSPSLAGLAPVAAAHHERLDGSGYHRGLPALALSRPARLLAAADAFGARCEPRPHRPAVSPQRAAAALAEEARAGRLDADAVAAVVEGAGQRAARPPRPAGLSDRETEVVGLISRGLQTKEVARRLGIAPKTADRHIQNAYAKMRVSTRAGAALFAVHHGLVAWGELPMVPR